MIAAPVDLLWQQRHRGLMPVSPHAVRDDGESLLICTDPTEPRTYQVLSVPADGEVREESAVAVETVHKFEGAPGGELLLAMTYDDVYVFRGGKKVRFAADHRAAYTDIALAAAAPLFACAYSNLLAGSHSLALGDADGRPRWTRNVDTPAAAVALAADGRMMVAALQGGRLLALEHARTVRWEAAYEDAPTALALAGGAERLVAGCESGAVLGLDDEGGLRWRAETGGPVVAVACDAAGEWGAAVHSDGALHRVTCFSPAGEPLWEHELEHAPTGVSLSANGRYLLVSLAGGVALLFRTDFGDAAGVSSARRRALVLEQARTARAQGQVSEAMALLQSILAERPHEVEAAQELLRLRAGFVAACRGEAREHAECGRVDAALEASGSAMGLDPWNEELFRERLAYRGQALEVRSRRARSATEQRDWTAAEEAWMSVLALDPGSLEARLALRRIRFERADALLRAGDERHAAGDLEGAIAHWREAEKLESSEELQGRLRRAEVEHSVRAGIAYYEAQRTAEAVFQLRKALALDPANAEASRYLGYAESLVVGSLIADRFAHLE